MNLGIPKNLHHIWIGNVYKPPVEWMSTWTSNHPSWDYRLWTSPDEFGFKNRKIIQKYIDRGWLAGAADLMRYEILYNFGGFIPPSDSICLENTEELFVKEGCYTVYENEIYRPGLVSPIYASQPFNPFLKTIIDRLSQMNTEPLEVPWKATGNGFLKELIEEIKPTDLTIFPSYFFIPTHYDGISYIGSEKIYSDQMWGTTKHKYERL